jgi:hypothetical protein
MVLKTGDWEAYQKFLKSCELGFWPDRVRNEVQRVREDSNILHRVNRRNANFIGHILCIKCLLKHVIEGEIEGRIEVKRRRGRRRQKLLDELKEMRGYWKLKDEALDRTLWRTGFGSGCGLVV